MTDGDGCWEWIGAKTDNGYGTIGGNAVRIRAHRLSWILHRGPIPDDLCVLHRCDNRTCVKPDHLFLGTYADNVADMNRKGRGRQGGPRGVLAGLAKLTPADVRVIRDHPYPRGTGKELARRFNVSPSAISCVRMRKSWSYM